MSVLIVTGTLLVTRRDDDLPSGDNCCLSDRTFTSASASCNGVEPVRIYGLGELRWQDQAHYWQVASALALPLSKDGVVMFPRRDDDHYDLRVVLPAELTKNRCVDYKFFFYDYGSCLNDQDSHIEKAM